MDAAHPHDTMAPATTRVMNLAHFLTRNARRFPDRPGFIWGDRSWTWREIDAAVSALATALAHRGIAKGDRILVHSKNCAEMFWSMFAAFRLGAVWVPTNFRLLPDEVSYLADHLRRQGLPVPWRLRGSCGGGRRRQRRLGVHLAHRRRRLRRGRGRAA